MRRDLIASIIAAVAFTLIFGLAYPLIATGVSQVLFPNKSDGSQVKVDGKTVGSKLIGQSFTIRRPNRQLEEAASTRRSRSRRRTRSTSSRGPR